MCSPIFGADTLDEYIAKLQALRARHGGLCPVMASGGDYPDAATGPRYITERQADAYVPAGTILLS